jgi:hypothetical protein
MTIMMWAIIVARMIHTVVSLPPQRNLTPYLSPRIQRRSRSH